MSRTGKIVFLVRFLRFKTTFSIKRKQEYNQKRENVMPDVKLKRSEPVDRALRRLKKKMDKEGTLKDLRNRRFYEKPSEEKRRKNKNK